MRRETPEVGLEILVVLLASVGSLELVFRREAGVDLYLALAGHQHLSNSD